MGAKIFGAEEVASTIGKIVEEIPERKVAKGETVEVSIGIKGYDMARDKRFRGEVTLPYAKRATEKVLVLADTTLASVLEGTDIPFVLFDSYKGKTKADKVARKKLAKKYHSFISVASVYKVFEPAIFTGKKKPIYMIKNPNEIKNFYEDVKRKVALNLKPDLLMGFSIGTTKMSVDEISQNFATAMGALIGLLKKGMQNIRFVRLKSAQGKAVRYY